jgi:hypothetical protein
MSIGNLKDSGNQGNNFPWQWKMLLGQQGALDELIAINANTDQVEGLLNQILAAILTGQDYEAMLVVDAANVTWLEVRIYNPDTGTFNPPIYFQAGNNTPGTPTAPITYINPNTYLATIASNTTGLATQTTLAAINSKLVNGNDIGDVTVNNGAGASAVNIQDGGNSITVDGTVELGATTLTALENITVQNGAGAAAVNIQDGGNSITVDGGTGVQRTPTFLRPTGSNGSVALGTYSMSFASVGTGNAIVGGIVLKPGETLNFDAGAINNTLGAVTYDTTTNAGAELIIITLT